MYLIPSAQTPYLSLEHNFVLSGLVVVSPPTMRRRALTFIPSFLASTSAEKLSFPLG
jgi:hypothetical protein